MGTLAIGWRAQQPFTTTGAEMALNRDKIGVSYPSIDHEITREEIHLYAKALGETDPRYLSESDDCVAPPTYAARFTVVDPMINAIGDEELGAHFALVHGSQSYEFGRPMRPGDVVTVTPTIADITYRGANEFLSLTLDASYADGTTCLASATTIVFLGSAPQKTEQPAKEA
ncbi:MAG: hypothetical protein ACI867_001155 [Glaciecola sp.]